MTTPQHLRGSTVRDRVALVTGGARGIGAATCRELAAGGAQCHERATPITDATKVQQILDKFRAKYGAEDVAAYYPKQDVAVEVPLD